MNKETLLIAGVFVGTLIVANYVMGMKVPKKAEPMSNASGGGRNKANKDGVCQCKGGVIGYCGSPIVKLVAIIIFPLMVAVVVAIREWVVVAVLK